jgi:hypothetical protein
MFTSSTTTAMSASSKVSARMHVEAHRLASFVPSKRDKHPKWPHPPTYSVTPATLARAGFYHHPVEDAADSARCFMCDKSLGGWEDGDDALLEHLAHSQRNCPYARLCAIQAAREANPEWYTLPEHAWLLDIHSPDAIQLRLLTFRPPGFSWPHDRKKGWKPTSQNVRLLPPLIAPTHPRTARRRRLHPPAPPQ